MVSELVVVLVALIAVAEVAMLLQAFLVPEVVTAMAVILVVLAVAAAVLLKSWPRDDLASLTTAPNC